MVRVELKTTEEESLPHGHGLHYWYVAHGTIEEKLAELMGIQTEIQCKRVQSNLKKLEDNFPKEVRLLTKTQNKSIKPVINCSKRTADSKKKIKECATMVWLA